MTHTYGAYMIDHIGCGQSLDGLKELVTVTELSSVSCQLQDMLTRHRQATQKVPETMKHVRPLGISS